MKKLFQIKSIRILILLILLGFNSHGQTLNITYQPMDPIGACKQNGYEVIFDGHSNLNQIDFTVDATILINSTPISTIPCSTGGSNGNYPVTMNFTGSSNVTVMGSPSYDPVNHILTFSMVPLSLSPCTVTFDAYIDCSIKYLISGAQNADLKQVWTASGYTPNVDNTTNNYHQDSGIDFPFLSHDPDFTISSPVYGQTYIAEFTYNNQGSGADLDFDIAIDASACANAITVDNNQVEYSIDNGINWNLVDPVNNEFIDQGNDILLRVPFTITGCMPCTSSPAVEIVFRWRCSETGFNNNACDQCDVNLISHINLGTGTTIGNLFITRLLPLNNGGTVSGGFAFWDQSCTGDDVDWSYKIEHTNNVDIPLTNFTLNYEGAAPALTTIDLNDFSYEYYQNGVLCPSCTSQVTLTTTNNPALFYCDANAPNSITLVINNFDADDHIIVNFKTTKCCINGDDFLNAPKYFNFWRVHCTFNDICTPALTHDASSNGAFSSNGSISSNYYNGAYNISQVLMHTPNVTDLSVPQGQTWGEPAFLDLKLLEVFGNYFDYELLGGSINTVNASVSAILRARISSQKGLRIDELSTDVELVNVMDPGLVLAPIAYYKEFNNNDCDSNSYFFYYPISNRTDIHNYLRNGKLNFKFISCCPGNPLGTVNYDVAFHLLMNSDLCGADFQVIDSVTPPQCTDCCWLPLSSVSNNISVHCPGCLAPGVIVDQYDLFRTNLGYADSNNDRIADNTNQPLTTTHPLYNDLDVRKSYHGDQLKDCMIAHVSPGDFGSGGYTLAQLEASFPGNEITVLQLDKTMPHKNTVGLHLEGFDFYIDEDLGGTPNCINCDDCNADPSLTTVLELHVDESGLVNWVEEFTDQFFFTFTKTALQAINSSFTFKENQRYRLSCRFTVCNNFTHLPGPDPLESDISCRMWLSGQYQPHNAFFNVPQMDNTYAAADFDTDPDYSDSVLFWCETFGRTHYFYSLNHVEQVYFGGFAGAGTCTQSITTHSFVYGGSDMFDLFPYEIRTPSLQFSQWQFVKPPGYIINDIKAWSVFRYYSLTAIPGCPYPPCATSCTSVLSSLNPAVYSSSPFIIDWSDLPTTITCVQDNSLSSVCNPGASLGFSDYITEINFRIELKVDPTICIPGTAYYVYLDGQNNHNVADFTNTCGGPIDVSSCTPYSSNGYIFHQDGQYLLTPAPTLNITAVNSSITASTNLVCWEFQATNYTGNTAENVYIGVPLTDVNYSFLTGWTASINGGLPILPDANGYFNFGPIGVSATAIHSIEICASYNECQEEFDMDLYWGWNCGGMPTTYPPQAPLTCNQNVMQVSVTDAEVDITTNNIQIPNEFNPCDPIIPVMVSADFNIITNVGIGEAYPQQVAILSSLPPGLALDGVLISNECDVGPPLQSNLSTSDGGATWQITSTNLNDIGFTQGYIVGGECVRVILLLIPDCSYDGQQIPSINLELLSYCGAPMTGHADFTPSWTASDISCCNAPCTGLDFSYTLDGCTFSADGVAPYIGLAECAHVMYAWNMGDGNFPPWSLTPDIQHTFAASGNYQVCFHALCMNEEWDIIFYCKYCEYVDVQCEEENPCLIIPKDYDADAGEAVSLADGGYAVAGTLHESGQDGDQDMYFLKMKNDNTIDFDLKLGDFETKDFEESGYSLLVRPDGYYVAGVVTNSETDNDVFVVKIKNNQSVDWAFRYATDGNVNEVARKILDMSDSNEEALLVVGHSTNVNDNTPDLLALKIDPATGMLLAQKNYGFENSKSNEYGYDAVVVSQGREYAIVGEENEDELKNTIVIIIDQNLNLTQGKVYSNAHDERNIIGTGIAKDKDNLYITGSTYVNNNSADAFIMSVSNSTLDLNYAARYPEGRYATKGNKIIVDNENNLVVSGEIKVDDLDGLVMKADPGLLYDPIWSRITGLEGDDWMNNLVEYDRSTLLTTGTYPGIDYNDEELFMIRMEANGRSCCLQELTLKREVLPVTTERASIEDRSDLKVYPHGDNTPYHELKVICDEGDEEASRYSANSEWIVNIVPNPGTGYFEVILNEPPDQRVTLVVRDVTGREVLRKSIEKLLDFRIPLDLTSKQPGVYLVEISGSGRKAFKKVILQN